MSNGPSHAPRSLPACLPPLPGAVFEDNLPILLIEDDATDADLLLRVLRRMPPPLPPVQHVARVADGVTALDRHRFQLVLVDLELPDSSYLETVEAIVAAARGMPVIALTGHHDEAMGRAVIAAGAQDYLVKGVIAVADLGRIIRHAQERQRSVVELQQAKAAMEHSLMRQQHLEEMRDQLVHMLVHDLRSPLFGVRLYLESLQREAGRSGTPKMGEDIEKAMEMTAQLTEMVSTILDVHRLEADALPLTRVVADVQQLADDATQALGSARRGQTVTNRMPPFLVSCDKTLIRRVLANLIANAYRFSPGDAPIVMDACIRGESVELSIQDQGPGVPPEMCTRIFEKFGALSQEDAYSTGLGLPFCKLVVELHGGRIGVDSAPGTGARFWFTLPVAPPPA